MVEASSSKATLGLAEIPSPKAVEVGTSRVAAWPDVALDLAGAFVVGPFFLSLGGGMDSFFLVSGTYFTFFEDKMSNVPFWARFLPIWMPFSQVEVIPFLGSVFTFANWGELLEVHFL